MESHEHLFFGCEYTSAVYTRVWEICDHKGPIPSSVEAILKSFMQEVKTQTTKLIGLLFQLLAISYGMKETTESMGEGGK